MKIQTYKTSRRGSVLGFIVFLIVIAGISWGIFVWRGKVVKAKEQAILRQQQEEEQRATDRQAKEEAAARASAEKQAALVVEGIKEADSLLAIYSDKVQSLAVSAEFTADALKQLATSPNAQQIKRHSSSLASQILVQQVTDMYAKWHQIIERDMESLRACLKKHELLGIMPIA